MKTDNVTKEVEDLREKLGRGVLYPNPTYQRNPVWVSSQKSKLILSILQDYPIGQVIVYRIQRQQEELVDGLQRLGTLVDFIDNKFALNASDADELKSKYPKLATIKKFKFKNLPKDLQDKILTTNINIAILENWQESDVREFFRRLQSGTPLKGSDKLWTIDTEITQKVKELCVNDRILSNLNLIHENGVGAKQKRNLYHSILTAIYLANNGQLGSPKKMYEYFEKNTTPSEIEIQTLNKIEEFLSKIDASDRSKFQLKSLKSDLVAMFSIVALNRFSQPIEDCKDFIIDFACGQSLVNDSKKANKKGKAMTTLIDYLIKTNLNDLYQNDTDLFDDFSTLRSGGHGKSKVEEIVHRISDLHNSLVMA